MNLKSAVSITVKGKVQGVWYRGSTKIKAEELKIFGYVKNLVNGDVYMEAEGSQGQISALVQWCKEGPELAIVDQVDVTPIDIKNFPTFEIRRNI